VSARAPRAARCLRALVAECGRGRVPARLGDSDAHVADDGGAPCFGAWTIQPLETRAMITRLWRGWTATEDADAYERFLLTELFPSIGRSCPGSARGERSGRGRRAAARAAGHVRSSVAQVTRTGRSNACCRSAHSSSSLSPPPSLASPTASSPSEPAPRRRRCRRSRVGGEPRARGWITCGRRRHLRASVPLAGGAPASPDGGSSLPRGDAETLPRGGFAARSRRFAEGGLSADEYRERRAVLGGAPEPAEGTPDE
jgi:hypothetical protein